MKIMFVCTGNTCRSPMAEFILKNLLAEDAGVEVCSAGLAGGGAPISVNTKKALQEIGIDPGYYMSRPALLDEMRAADYVAVMTNQQKNLLMSTLKDCQNIYTLGELAGGGEVADPFGQDIEAYRRTRESLSEMLRAMAIRLKLPLKSDSESPDGK